MKVLLLGLLAFLHAAAPPAHICAVINTQVAMLRDQKKLSSPGKIRLQAGRFTYDRYLGANYDAVEQTSAVFLTSDGKHVIKIYPTEQMGLRAPELEYWASKYLLENKVRVPAMKGLPELVSRSRLDEVTRDFLDGVNIEGTKVIIVVKEHVPGLTGKELKQQPEISAEERPALLQERDGERKKIEALFDGSKFDQWLRRQGPRAVDFANQTHGRPDTLGKNFILTDQGWVLFDP